MSHRLPLILYLALASFSTFAEFKKDIFLKGRLLRLDSDKYQATILGADIGLGVANKVGSLQMEGKLGVNVETGTSASTYGDFNEFKEKNYIYLDSASILWAPCNYFFLAAGAINQRMHQAPLFLSDIPFLSLLEGIKYKVKNVTLELVAQQSLPKNSSLSSRFGTIEEGAPLFFSEKFVVSYKSDKLHLGGHLRHFAFDKLSRAVAYKSMFMGNSVVGSGSSGTIFKYSFIGWEGGVNIHYSTLSLNARFIENSKAPQGASYYLSAEIAPRIHGHNTFFHFAIFQSEADAVPGYYSSKYFGHQNREGLACSLGLLIDGWGRLGLNFVKADLIKNNSLQSDEVISFLSFEGNIFSD